MTCSPGGAGPYRGAAYRNHNRLLGSVAGVDGIKTGYTRPAGWNLAASAEVGGRRVVAVVMGGKSRVWRDRRMKELLSNGFRVAAANDLSTPLPGEHPGYGPNGVAVARAEPAAAPAVGRDDGSGAVLAVAAATQADASAAAVQPVEQGSAEGAGWALQVGAFAHVSGAYDALDSASPHLAGILGPHPSTVVTTTQSGDVTLYRARIVNLTERQARQGCDALYRRDLPCAVVRYVGGA